MIGYHTYDTKQLCFMNFDVVVWRSLRLYSNLSHLQQMHSVRPTIMTLALRRGRRYYRRSRQELLPIATCVLLLAAVVPLGVVLLSSRSEIRRTSDNSRVTDGASLLSRTTVRSGGYKKGYCTGDNPRNFLKSSNRAFLALLLPGIVFFFVGLAVVTDDFFVPALERICESLSLSEDVAGATFMAAGSSAPELFTSLLAALWTKDDVGIGTIVGSAVFNILIIIGLSAALAGTTLQLDPRPLLRDSFFYCLSVIMLLLFVMVGGKTGRSAGVIMWWEGLIFVIGYGIYILFMKFLNKRYMNLKCLNRLIPKQLNTDASVASSVENGHSGRAQPVTEAATPTQPDLMSSANTHDVPEEPAGSVDVPDAQLQRSVSKYYELNPRSHFRMLTYAVIATNSFMGERPPVSASEASIEEAHVVRSEAETVEEKKFLGVTLPKSWLGCALFPFFFPWRLAFQWTIADCNKFPKRWPLTFAVSIVWIMAISFLMVEATRLSGCFVGIPSAVMGLTFLAAGTSVPDALASVAVARNGFGNMAVSNAIGSNVFDILLGLGLPWFIAGLISLKEGSEVTVDPLTLVVVPIAILFAIILILIAILFAMKWRLSKKLGYLLFALYGVFFIYSLLDVFVFNRGNL